MDGKKSFWKHANASESVAHQTDSLHEGKWHAINSLARPKPHRRWHCIWRQLIWTAKDSHKLSTLFIPFRIRSGNASFVVTSPLTFSPNKIPPIKICDHRTDWSVRFWIKRYLWTPFICGGGGIKLLEYPKLAAINGYVWWAGSNRFLKSTFCLAFIFHIAKCTTQIGYGNKFFDFRIE